MLLCGPLWSFAVFSHTAAALQSVSTKWHVRREPGARFTEYLTTILRLSYDNAEVTIDLRRTTNLLKIFQRTQGYSQLQFARKIVQEAQLSPSDRAMRLVSSNLANYYATVQKLLRALRQVLTKPMV